MYADALRELRRMKKRLSDFGEVETVIGALYEADSKLSQLQLDVKESEEAHAVRLRVMQEEHDTISAHLASTYADQKAQYQEGLQEITEACRVKALELTALEDDYTSLMQQYQEKLKQAQAAIRVSEEKRAAVEHDLHRLSEELQALRARVLG